MWYVMWHQQKCLRSAMSCIWFAVFADALADLGGRARQTPLPQASGFFHFYIQNFRNVATSGVHVPPRGPRPPYGKSWIHHCDVKTVILCWFPNQHSHHSAFNITSCNLCLTRAYKLTHMSDVLHKEPSRFDVHQGCPQAPPTIHWGANFYPFGRQHFSEMKDCWPQAFYISGWKYQ